MTSWRWLSVAVLLSACGPTLSDRLHQVTAECNQALGTTVQRERFCQERQREAMVAYGEPAGRWQESRWAFRLLVAERLDAGRITPAEAQFVLAEHERRMELQRRGLRAAEDAASAAEMNNYLNLYRHFYPNR